MNETALAAWSALAGIADPYRLVMLFGGVIAGLVVGVIPGLGGIVGLTLILPFTYAMDPPTALAVMIGLHAVVATSDSIPAILFGVPGTVGSAATVLDGYPMARQGEAGRALGAAFTSSMLGGLFGALLLGLMIPVMRPLMLAIGSPEMFAFCIFGLSLAAAISGRNMLRGLGAACLGLSLSMVGEDYQTGTMRLTFDTLYLWQGIPILPLTLGLFALPELGELVIQRSPISQVAPLALTGRARGVRDVLGNPFVLLRSSAIGAILGAMPGLGSAVIDWIAYGSVVRSRVPDPHFGKGDVRGVIASEAANNAKEGGALVPTIAFGVPGSAGMAILLSGLFVQGIVPGPEMLSKHLDLTYTLVFSLAIANVVGAGLCFLFAGSFARLATVQIGILAPVVLATVFIAAFQGAGSWGDLAVLLGAGVLGHVMRLLRWPRPPLLLGFVLGILVERYLATSIQIYGAAFLLRPVVLVTLGLTAWGIFAAPRRHRKGGAAPFRLTWSALRLTPDTALALSLLAVFAAIVAAGAGWPRAARVVPQSVALVGAVLMLAALFTRRADERDALHFDLPLRSDVIDAAQLHPRGLAFFAWLLGYAGLAALVGPLWALPIWVIGYARFGFGLPLSRAVLVGIGFFLPSYAIFDLLLHSQLPQGLLSLR